MRTAYQLLFLSIFSLIVSCASHQDVRPGVNGVHSITLEGEARRPIAQEALRQAKSFCGEQEKYAAISKESYTYIGGGDEEDYRRAKGLTRAVGVIGSSAVILGQNKDTKNLGLLASIAGSTGNAYLGNGYRIRMRFVCR